MLLQLIVFLGQKLSAYTAFPLPFPATTYSLPFPTFSCLITALSLPSQVLGRKLFHLWEPEQAHLLHPHPYGHPGGRQSQAHFDVRCSGVSICKALRADKRANTSPVKAVVREMIMEWQVHFQSSD